MPAFTIPPTNDDIADLAEQALSAVPVQLARFVQDLALRVEDAADAMTLRQLGLGSLWEVSGLYRGGADGQGDGPDLIVLYRQPLLLEWIETGESLFRIVRATVVREIMQYFKFSETDMARIERLLD